MRQQTEFKNQPELVTLTKIRKTTRLRIKQHRLIYKETGDAETQDQTINRVFDFFDKNNRG
jgi:hypothetical protein